MEEITENMNKTTENSFSLPLDNHTEKEPVQHIPEFHFIQGNITDVPVNHSTGWRSMPFHLCVMAIRPQDASSLLEIKGEKEILTSENSFLFIPAGTVHRFTEYGTTARQSIWIHFTATFMGGLDIFSIVQPTPVYRTDAHTLENFRNLLLALIRFPKHPDLYRSVRFQLLSFHLVDELLSFFPDKQLSPNHFRQVARMQSVIQCLHTADRLPSTTELASRVHLSPSRFLAAFHELFHTSPGHYWQIRRHARACEMLLANIPIGEIADKLGYSDLFHFSRSFKKHTGLSPSQYRNKTT